MDRAKKMSDYVTYRMIDGTKLTVAKGTKRCSFYTSAKGCFNGDACKFLHMDKFDSAKGKHVGKARYDGDGCGREGGVKNLQYGSKPCMFFSSAKGCIHGDACQFLHTYDDANGHSSVGIGIGAANKTKNKSKNKTTTTGKPPAKKSDKRMKLHPVDATARWLHAINSCGREMNAPDDAIQYLLVLKEKLQKKYVHHFDDAPTMAPPARGTDLDSRDSHDDDDDDDDDRESMNPISSSKGSSKNQSDNTNKNTSCNGKSISFSVFNFDDASDDDDDHDRNDGHAPGGVNENAINGVSAHNADVGGGRRMAIRNIFLRCLVMLGDCLGARAGSAILQGKGWMSAASDFENYLQMVQGARQVADEALAMLLQLDELGTDSTGEDLDGLGELAGAEARRLLQEHLVEDSRIIEVSSSHAEESKKVFLTKARNRAKRLEGLLMPQWEKRNHARAAMGEDRWMNNTNIKGVAAQKRLADERELRELNAAMDRVRQLDFQAVAANAQGVLAALL
jgi:hypothetical protein